MSASCHEPPDGPRRTRRRLRGGAAAPTGHVLLALAGNPNVGKSSLFNAVTGSRQHVANWPGKTVARTSGERVWGDVLVEVVDLPGAYSLAAWSPEEGIARDELVDGHADVVAVVLDATNVERGLYLALEVAELGRPLVVVLNFADRADAEGIVVDADRLAASLGAPVVRTVGSRGVGIDRLLDVVVAEAGARRPENAAPTRPQAAPPDVGLGTPTTPEQVR